MIKPCVHHSMIRVIESTMHMGTPGDGHRHIWDAACTRNGDQTLFQQSTMASTLQSTQSYMKTNVYNHMSSDYLLDMMTVNASDAAHYSVWTIPVNIQEYVCECPSNTFMQVAAET